MNCPAAFEFLNRRAITAEIFTGKGDNAIESATYLVSEGGLLIRSSGAVQSNSSHAARTDIPLKTKFLAAWSGRLSALFVGDERGHPLRSLLRAIRKRYEDLVV